MIEIPLMRPIFGFSVTISTSSGCFVADISSASDAVRVGLYEPFVFWTSPEDITCSQIVSDHKQPRMLNESTRSPTDASSTRTHNKKQNKTPASTCRHNKLLSRLMQPPRLRQQPPPANHSLTASSCCLPAALPRLRFRYRPRPMTPRPHA